MKNIWMCGMMLGTLAAGWLVGGCEQLAQAEKQAGKEAVANGRREIENSLLGMPFVFGDGDAHNPNRASLMVRATATHLRPF